MTQRKARATALALALAALSCAAPKSKLPAKPEGAPALEVKGEIKGGPVQLGDGDLARLPQRKVRGTDPLSGRTAEWEGTDLAALLARVVARPGSDTVTIRTADGVAVPLNLSKIQQYRPVIATRSDGQPLSPNRLAWPNTDQPGLARDPRHRPWWATGVVAIEIAPWSRSYGRALAVPAGASEGARPGGGLFVQRCVFCHEMRGAGGKKGPALTLWAEKNGLDALSTRLAAHPGRLPDDQEADFVPPLQAYLTAMVKAPPLEALPDRPGEGKGDGSKAPRDGEDWEEPPPPPR
jgi:hypothetical protein